MAAPKRVLITIETEESNVEGTVLEKGAGEDGVWGDGGGVRIDDGAHEFGLEGRGAIETKLQLGKLTDEERLSFAGGPMLDCELREEIVEDGGRFALEKLEATGESVGDAVARDLSFSLWSTRAGGFASVVSIRGDL